MTGRSQYPKSVKAGVPRLAPCPPGWRTVRFGDVLEAVYRRVELEDDGTYELVKVLRNRKGVVSRGTLQGQQILTKTQFRVCSDDFLISRRQIVHGACGLVPENLDGAVVSNEYSALRSKGGLHTAFLPFLAGTDYFQLTCFHCSVGVHVEKMIFKIEKWLRYHVNIPPIRTQRAIADILGDWEGTIGGIGRLIEAKQELRRGLAQQLLSGRLRSPGFSDEWSHRRLNDVTRHLSARNKGDLSAGSVKAVNKSQGLIPMKENVRAASLDRYKRVPPKAFAYNPMRLNIGSITMSEENADVLVSPDYVVFRCLDDKLYPDYLNHLRRTHAWKHFVNIAGNGSVRIRIYYKDLAAMPLHLPSIEEQRRIAGVLNACDQEIRLLKAKLESLKEQKKGLMQKLLTGKIRLKEAAA